MMDRQQHTPDTIRRALAYIPAHDRDTWIKVGMGVKSELGDEGFPMFDEWSQSAPDQYNARDTEAAWKSFKPNGGTTIGTTLHLAKMNGFDVASAASRRVAAPPARERVPAVDTAKEAKAAEEAKGKATRLWQEASPAAQDNAYLKRKGVASVLSLREIRDHHARQILNYTPRQGEEELAGPLLVVPIKRAGELVSAELIDGAGRKHCIFGSKVSAAYWAAQPLPTPSDLVTPNLCIGEGVGTMLSIREATELLVVAARYAGNLEQVAVAMRGRYPKARIVIAADVGNGQAQAAAAARACGGRLALPAFGDGAPDGAKDFNDLHQLKGLEAVRACIEAASAPDVAEALAPRPLPTNRTGAIVEGTATTQAGIPEGVAIIRADSVETKPVEWLWDGYLAAGKVHIMAGAPGTGKTTLAMGLAAALTCGGRWPDGSRAAPGAALIWSGEDSADDTLVPRLIASGAALDRVHFVGDRMGADGARAFDPSTDFALLELEAARIPGLRLVIVDPIVSAIAGDGHKSNDVRRGLQPLVRFAERTRCAVLGISHFSKGTAGKDPVERVTGSIAFGALARVVLATAKVPEEDGGGRIMVRAKANNSPDGGGFRYDLRVVNLEGKYAGIVTTRPEWLGAVEGEAREILATAERETDPEERTTADEVTDWLHTLLTEEGGSVDRRDVMRSAQAMGFKERTVHRARVELGLQVIQTGFGRDKRSLWKRDDASMRANETQSCQPLEGGMHGKSGTHGDVEGAARGGGEVL